MNVHRMTQAQEPSMNLLSKQPHSTADGTKSKPSLSGPALLDSQDLLQGQNAVAITHNGALYRLQTTRQGKLILTK